MATGLCLLAVAPVWAQAIPPCPAPGTPLAKRTWKGGMPEYNAYIAASKLTGAAQAQAFAAFLQKYPQSDYRLPALQQEMAGYVTAKNYAAAERTAEAVLKNPHAPAAVQAGAFTVIAYYLPNAAANLPATSARMSQDLVRIDWAARCGQQALAATQAPAQKKAQASYVFNRAAGFVALQRHHYAAASRHFQSAVEFNSKDAQSYYWLGIAELYKKPADFSRGLFYVARAQALAPSATTISSYLQKAYTSYHGSTQGLNSLESTAQGSAQPPSGFKIQSARDIAMAQYQAELQKVNAANAAARAKLYPADTFRGIKQRLMNPATRMSEWKQVKGQTYQLQGVVVSATLRTVDLSVDPFDQQAKPPKVDVHLVLAAPRRVHAGAHVTITGTATAFHTTPSFLMVMNKGKVG